MYFMVVEQQRDFASRIGIGVVLADLESDFSFADMERRQIWIRNPKSEAIVF